MKTTKYITKILISLALFAGIFNPAISLAEEDNYSYDTYRSIDAGTFNEYRYKITKEFFALREYFQIEGSLNKEVLKNLENLVNESYKYLPGINSKHENYKNNALISIKKGAKYPNDQSNYSEISEELGKYIDKVTLNSVKGNIEATPTTGNAPLVTTLRGRVKDESGTNIPDANYTWWINDSGTKKIIGHKSSITYTFNEEGTFTIFLDVKSSHKNSYGNIDVLPFRSRTEIEVKEKVASLIIDVNNDRLRSKDELKFTPSEGKNGLIFDITSSTPTGGAKFIKTEWDFGNGIEKDYDTKPKIERVIYANEGEYTVSLKLETNEGKEINRKFIIAIHDPISTIKVNKEEGFLGDKFTFSAKNSISDEKNLTYFWKITETGTGNIVYEKAIGLFSYVFKKKGRYNVQLKVREASGEEDHDDITIYINSRAPIADFSADITKEYKPNTVYLDASKSYDPDFSDEGKLVYNWMIDGNSVNLENPEHNGAIGEYTFSSLGEHSIVLEVVDPDDIPSIKKGSIRINSLLSVNFNAYPRAIQRGGYIKFIANSPNAKFYEWDFNDGKTKSGNLKSINHTFEKSGIYDVKLTVKGLEGDSNSFTKRVYVGESNKPVSLISVNFGDGKEPIFKEGICEGKGAYILNRVKNSKFSGAESINIDGKKTNLSYSWKIGYNAEYFTTQDVTHKFDETGCFPVRLRVKNTEGGQTSERTEWVKVVNLKPTLGGLTITKNDNRKDPIVLNVTADNASDPDGVIQSYLWYYYTDTDSEPQDFRATSVPSTSFVLPKITGTYYFVVVMKDSNEERISSDEISSSKYFITLEGDNINTPLIDLKINNSSVTIGEEVAFTTKVKNILGDSISTKSEFSWDFNGDGFYEKKSNSGNISHSFNESGTFHSKVKAKYKGMSNIKTITINVANKIIPDFKYVAIGKKALFLDQSIGKIDSRSWNLGDGKKDDKEYFIHEYSDKKKVHKVILNVQEGTKTKNKYKITRIGEIKSGETPPTGLKIVSIPSYDEKTKSITLKNKFEKVLLYLGESTNKAKYYAVDYDVETDSNLNGGKDDDIDNINDASFKDGSPLIIPLTKSSNQKIRVYLLGEDKKTIIGDTKDIEIKKLYIKESDLNIDKVVFDGLSNEDKINIEKIKDLIEKLPKKYRLNAVKYIQLLKEGWFDDRERTQVILNFEGFISSIENVDSILQKNIINALELLLVKGEEDKSEANMSINIIKGLTKDIEEYKSISSKLDEIRENKENIEANKKLGQEIWSIVKSSSISKEDKKTVQIHLNLIIPIHSADKIDAEKKVEKSSIIDKIIGVSKFILYIILVLFIILSGIIIVFWIMYKLSNSGDNLGFQDFIIEKTSGNKSKDKKPDDILGNINTEEKKEPKTPAPKIVEKTPEKNNPPKETKKETPAPSFENGNGSVPSWLKGNQKHNEQEKKVEKKENKTPAPKTENKTPEKTTQIDNGVPNWLKEQSKTPKKNTEATTETPKTTETKEEDLIPKTKTKTPETKKPVEKTTQIDNSVPNWLKEQSKTPKKNTEATTETPKTTETKEEDLIPKTKTKTPETKKPVEKKETNDFDALPDWLQNATKPDEEDREATTETPKTTETKKEDLLPDWLSSDTDLSIDSSPIDEKNTIEENTLELNDMKLNEQFSLNDDISLELPEPKKTQPKKTEVKKTEVKKTTTAKKTTAKPKTAAKKTTGTEKTEPKKTQTKKPAKPKITATKTASKKETKTTEKKITKKA